MFMTDEFYNQLFSTFGSVSETLSELQKVLHLDSFC